METLMEIDQHDEQCKQYILDAIEGLPTSMFESWVFALLTYDREWIADLIGALIGEMHRIQDDYVEGELKADIANTLIAKRREEMQHKDPRSYQELIKSLKNEGKSC